MKIRKKYIEVIVWLSIIPLILMTIIYLFIFNKSSMHLSEQLIAVAADNQSKVLDDFFYLRTMELNDFKKDKLIIKYLKSKEDEDILEDKSEKDIQIRFKKYRQDHYLDSISIIDDNGTVVTSSNIEYIGQENIISESDIEILEKNEDLISYIANDKERVSDNCIVIASPIFINDVYYGAVVELINIKVFNKLITNAHIFTEGQVAIFDEDYNLVLYDEGGYVLSDNNTDLYDNIKIIGLNDTKCGLISYKDGSRKMIGYYSVLTSNNWRVLLSYDESNIKLPFREVFDMTIIIIIIIIICIIIVNLKAIKYFSKPIDDFIRVIEKIENGKYSERFIYNKNNELGMMSKAFNKLIDKINSDSIIIEKYNEELELMIKNIPGGVYCAKVLENKLESFYVSEHYLKITGDVISDDKNMHLALIKSAHEKDKEKVINTLKKSIDNKEDFDIDYRIVTNEGKVVWIKNRGKIVSYKDQNILHGVIIDITEEKNAVESLMISEEKYHIICEHIDNLYFQWDAEKDKLNVCEKWNESFMYGPVEDDLVENLIHSKNIHKDDIGTIINTIRKVMNGTKKAECEIRILTKDDIYIWVKIKATGIFDNENNLKRVMGMVININDEKIEKEKLIYEAQRDGLTKLYNKTNTELFIDEYIKTEGKNKTGSLFILDLDDFKSINDNMGHINGDKALMITAENLRTVFGENNIIGRIGGDEFIAFLKDADYSCTVECAEKLTQTFRCKTTDNSVSSRLSTSIGISMYPKDGYTFNELYKKADKVLYNAKLKGKDGYCIYNEEVMDK